jgi:hypothetical protein
VLSQPSLGELVELARRVPAPPGYRLPEGASEQELSAFESWSGLRIPPQLREWLGKVNGSMIGPGGTSGVDSADKDLSIQSAFGIYPVWRALGWIPVAGDGLGNRWVTLAGPDGSEGWVAFVNTHVDPEAIDCYVASGVFIFLGFLLESELGEKGWPGNDSYVISRDPKMSLVPDPLTPWNPRRKLCGSRRLGDIRGRAESGSESFWMGYDAQDQITSAVTSAGTRATGTR